MGSTGRAAKGSLRSRNCVAGRAYLKCCDDLLRVVGWFYFGPDFFNFAVRPNEEGDPVHSKEFAAHAAFFGPDTVGLGDLLVFVRQQDEWQPVLRNKFVVGLCRVLADPDDDCTP